MNGHSQTKENRPAPPPGVLDPRSVERWFRDHADGLYTFVFHRVGRNREIAADVVQETFLTALGRIESYDPARGGMPAWLSWLARNHIRDAMREQRRSRGLAGFQEQVDQRVLKVLGDLDAEPLPEEILEREETRDLVRTVLSRLPGRYRLALTRRYCDRTPLKEMARREGTSEGAVKSLLHRARQAFQAAFRSIAKACGEQRPAGEAIR